MSYTLQLKTKTCRNISRLSRVRNTPWTSSLCHLLELEWKGAEALWWEFGNQPRRVSLRGLRQLVLGRRRQRESTNKKDVVDLAVERVIEVRDREGSLRNQKVRAQEFRTPLILNEQEVELVGLRTAAVKL
jgi:hypothetical protein